MEEKNVSKYSMHRLVQLSTQKWLEYDNKLASWQEATISAIARAIPLTPSYECWPMMFDLGSHVQTVLSYDLDTESSQLHRATILQSLGHFELEQGHDKLGSEHLVESGTIRKRILGPEH